MFLHVEFVDYFELTKVEGSEGVLHLYFDESNGAYAEYGYDKLNRITKCLHYSKRVDSDGVREYVYDNKKTPFYHCTIPKWAIFYLWEYRANKNNIESTPKNQNLLPQTTQRVFTKYAFSVGKLKNINN